MLRVKIVWLPRTSSLARMRLQLASIWGELRGRRASGKSPSCSPIWLASRASPSARERKFAFTLMRGLAKLMDDAVREQGGVVQGFTGDGVMAVFGAPVALEDAPLRACRAALSILRRLKITRNILEAEHGVRPQVRIGLNTGLCGGGQRAGRRRCGRYGSRRHGERCGAVPGAGRGGFGMRDRVDLSLGAGPAIKWMQRLNETGSIAAKPSGGSISPLEAHAAVLLGLIAEQADLTLDEIVAVMRKRRIAGSRSAVWRFFKRHNVSFKKKPARSGAAASRCGPRPAALDARTRHV